MLIFRSPGRTCAGLGCAGLGVVDALAACGELDDGVAVAAVPVVEDPDGEYAGLADDDVEALGGGSGSPVVGQEIAGSDDHRLELADHRLEPDHGLSSSDDVRELGGDADEPEVAGLVAEELDAREPKDEVKEPDGEEPDGDGEEPDGEEPDEEEPDEEEPDGDELGEEVKELAKDVKELSFLT